MPRNDWRIELRKSPAAELRALRKVAGLTQAGAAERWGVSEQQYGNYERCESEIPSSLLQFAKGGFRLSSSEATGLKEEDAVYISSPGGIRPTLRDNLGQFLSQIERLMTDADNLVGSIGLFRASLKRVAQEIELALSSNRSGG